MCGRYVILTDEEIAEMREILEEISQRYRDTALLARMKTGEIRPTDVAPVLVLDDDAIRADLMSWGYPKFPGQGSGVVFNTRNDSAATNPMWAQSFANRRCLIPTNGFYEWKPIAGTRKKEKNLITLPGRPVLYMAGLYDIVRSTAGDPYKVYSILTIAANASIAKLHNRMPLILHDEAVRSVWLSDNKAALDLLSSADSNNYDVKPEKDEKKNDKNNKVETITFDL